MVLRQKNGVLIEERSEGSAQRAGLFEKPILMTHVDLFEPPVPVDLPCGKGRASKNSFATMKVKPPGA